MQPNSQLTMEETIREHNLHAEQAKNIGMLMAEAKANDDCSGWSDRAMFYFTEFLKEIGDRSFLAEEAREWCIFRGLPAPKNHRAWGSVICKAVKMKLIQFCGYEKTSNPLAHSTPAGVWKQKKL